MRTDNTGLINETGLVSWRKGGDTKVQLVTAFKAKPRDWLAAGGEKTLRPRGENNIDRMCNKEIPNATASLHKTRGNSTKEINMLKRILYKISKILFSTLCR